MVEGEHAGQPFVLQPWQHFGVGSLFGWLSADGHRRFRTAYFEIGKGNGKTPMGAGVLLYGLTMDGEAGAECYCAATSRDQARIAFGDAKKMAEASPALARHLEIGEHNIAHLASRSFLRPVSSEGRGLDGKRVHMALVDELHEHLSDIVVEKMRAGTKGRRQALIFEITNSGYDRLSVCWRHHAASLETLEAAAAGRPANDSWFAYVCQLDPCDACRAAGKDQPHETCATCDQITDPRVWIKPNPNIGVSITEKYLAERVQEAVEMPATRNHVLRYNGCTWTEQISRWIPMDRWHDCGDDVPDEDLVGAPCYGGLDLGQSDDFSAFVRLFLIEDGRAVVRCRFWMPEVALTKFRNRPYDEWKRAGVLEITEGDTADKDLIEKEVAELCHASGVRILAYDNRFAEHMALHLQGLGIEMVNTPQGYQLNEALGRLLDLILDRRLRHGAHPILSWMASNTVVRHGLYKQIRLDKDRASEKIDGIAALAMAMDLVISAEGGSVYDARGLLTV